ncbi:hypothetical protein [Streptomyces qinglanensis]|uniref:hypothetical protein n=1 Tax=Streptomyces qinglanensis TaxID=943816 RepID=UPI003D710C34
MAQPIVTTAGRQNTREERAAASRVVLDHARSPQDLHELLDALGLTQPRPDAEAPALPTPEATDA